MTEDWKLLLCKLPVSKVLQEDYTKNEEYRFLNLAISWKLLGLLAVLDTHLKKMYSGFDILMSLRLFIVSSHVIELDSLRQVDWLNNVENCPWLCGQCVWAKFSASWIPCTYFLNFYVCTVQSTVSTQLERSHTPWLQSISQPHLDLDPSLFTSESCSDIGSFFFMMFLNFHESYFQELSASLLHHNLCSPNCF